MTLTEDITGLEDRYDPLFLLIPPFYFWFHFETVGTWAAPRTKHVEVLASTVVIKLTPYCFGGS